MAMPRIGVVAALVAFSAVAVAQTAMPLAQRIGRSDPGKMQLATGVHGGAGSMRFGALLGANALSTNFIFLHRGTIAPKSGIGQHFHNDCEEMFVILDGEAEFTIDGRTSRLTGPAGAPDRKGHAHGIYNPTDKPVQWLNINVGMTKSYDNFDLGDPRTNAPLDPVPQFITMRLDRSLLKPAAANLPEATGAVLYRRALGPTIFSTAWSYVDHILLPAGSALGRRIQPDMSEVYYVMSGTGEVTLGDEAAPIKAGDAVPVDLGEARAIRQTGGEPLELMVIGVARDLAAKARYRAEAEARMRPRR
ncbi:cupin domain-containing protein [Sphingomonas cannabina]|uniref:cupin domain-containing protein n=1 Tax=Sphingomonas cannabina TaxID=2899123 RepID=UPI001F1FCB65|nr:cupin domain-containing protein [Sphingomonas cannabina]UIJ44160.1 cupin domain-containing protein [Sphingomonas cannabina]